MMDKKTVSSELFCGFSLERRIRDDHLLRKVKTAVDSPFVRRFTKRFYSHTGQPSMASFVVFSLAPPGLSRASSLKAVSSRRSC